MVPSFFQTIELHSNRKHTVTFQLTFTFCFFFKKLDLISNINQFVRKFFDMLAVEENKSTVFLVHNHTDSSNSDQNVVNSILVLCLIS